MVATVIAAPFKIRGKAMIIAATTAATMVYLINFEFVFIVP